LEDKKSRVDQLEEVDIEARKALEGLTLDLEEQKKN